MPQYAPDCQWMPVTMRHRVNRFGSRMDHDHDHDLDIHDPVITHDQDLKKNILDPDHELPLTIEEAIRSLSSRKNHDHEPPFKLAATKDRHYQIALKNWDYNVGLLRDAHERYGYRFVKACIHEVSLRSGIRNPHAYLRRTLYQNALKANMA